MKSWGLWIGPDEDTESGLPLITNHSSIKWYRVFEPLTPPFSAPQNSSEKADSGKGHIGALFAYHFVFTRAVSKRLLSPPLRITYTPPPLSNANGLKLTCACTRSAAERRPIMLALAALTRVEVRLGEHKIGSSSRTKNAHLWMMRGI